MNKTLKILIGCLISGISLWFVLRGFNSAQLYAALKEANYIWLLPALIFYVMGYVFRTFRWKVFLSPLWAGSFFILLPVLIFGFFMNMVLPARSGEFLRAFAAHKKLKLPTPSMLGSIVAERISDLLGLFFVMVLCINIIPLDKIPLKKFGILISIAAGFIVLLFLFANKFLATKYKSDLINKIAGLLKNLVAGFSALKSIKKVGIVVVLSLVVWTGEIFQVYFMSRFMGLDLHFLQSAAVILGFSVGVMIPAGPGFVGTFEFFGTQMLRILGFEVEPSLNFVIVYHAYIAILICFVGIISTFFLFKKDESLQEIK